jgi:hypothetical protein
MFLAYERSNDNLVGASMIARDITERKEREHLLIREINHRAKNRLSVVDAIRSPDGSQNSRRFHRTRIQALPANQDLLIRNDWHGIESEGWFGPSLPPSPNHIDSRIVVRGPGCV